MLQLEIEEKYYETLFSKTESDEQAVLSKWYKKDEKFITAKYIIQPIDEVLGYGNQKLWLDILSTKTTK